MTIEKYTKGMSFSDFETDGKTVDACLMQFVHLGESLKKVKNIPDGISGKEIMGFRDFIAHHYFGIDVESVWQTIQDDLPVMKKSVVDSMK